MSTTTGDRRDSALQLSSAEIRSETDASGKNIQNWLCIILVFVAGAASLAIEVAASRLLAPYFGSSLFVWANLIGLILLYLTVGYYVGGLLADRQPYPQLLYAITAVAALLIGVIPLIAQPILTWALNTFATSFSWHILRYIGLGHTALCPSHHIVGLCFPLCHSSER